MVTCGRPFTVILIGGMSFRGEGPLGYPFLIRSRFVQEAIRGGVRRCVDEHDDNFRFGNAQIAAEAGAGADSYSGDPARQARFKPSRGIRRTALNAGVCRRGRSTIDLLAYDQ